MALCVCAPGTVWPLSLQPTASNRQDKLVTQITDFSKYMSYVITWQTFYSDNAAYFFTFWFGCNCFRIETKLLRCLSNCFIITSSSLFQLFGGQPVCRAQLSIRRLQFVISVQIYVALSGLHSGLLRYAGVACTKSKSLPFSWWISPPLRSGSPSLWAWNGLYIYTYCCSSWPQHVQGWLCCSGGGTCILRHVGVSLQNLSAYAYFEVHFL